MAERLLVIIPCLNEASNVRRLLDELARLPVPHTALVVDDGSTDGTAEAARDRAIVLRLPVNLGIGGAVQTGIRYGVAHDFDLCLQLDGDHQHPPSQIARLLESHRSRRANLTIGSRFLRGDGFRSTWPRRVGIALIRSMLTLLTGARLTDPTSGYRLLDRKAMALFAGEYPDDYPEPVSIVQALRRGLTVAEVPVTMDTRRTGKSSIRGLKTLAYMLRVVMHMVLARA